MKLLQMRCTMKGRSSNGRVATRRRSRPPQGVTTVLAASLVMLASATSVATAAPFMNDCDDAIAAANLLNDSGNYAGALSSFDAIVEECDSKNEKIAIRAGRAHALNQLGRYSEAYEAANAALEEDDEHLFALFERAYANENLGNDQLAVADYNRIIELTEKNQNVAERATLYAKVADMYFKAGMTAEADQYMARAIELDPTNPDFAIIQGDWAASTGDYDAAQASYDQAIVKGMSEAEASQIKAEASLKQVQDKYGTTNTQELRAQMTPAETEQVCGDVTKALTLGWKNPQMDMFTALVCQ